MWFFCRKEVDSVEHMLLNCEISKELWFKVENWIIELGMENYRLTNGGIVLRDLENASSINTIILLTKLTNFNAMKREQRPNVLTIKMTQFLLQEKYRHYIRGKGKIFDKQYILLSRINVKT